MEMSGQVNVDAFIKKVLAGKYTKEQITSSYPAFNAVPDTLNVYVKLSAEVAQNQVDSIKLSDVEVMGVALPASIIDSNEAQDEVRSILNSYLVRESEKTKGTYTSIKIENGELQISGMLPSSHEWEKIQ